MKRSYLISLLTVVSHTLLAQYNVMQDGEGKSSFPVFENNTLNVNAQEKKIAFSITFPEMLPDSVWNFGALSLSLKGKDKSFPIVKNGIFNFEGNLTYAHTWYLNQQAKSAFYVVGNLGVSRLQTYDSTQISGEQIETQSPLNSYVQVGFIDDALTSFEKGGLIFGFGFRLGWSDNVSGLTSYEFFTPIANGQQIITPDAKTVYLAQEYAENIFNTSTMLDIGLNTNGRINPMLHVRHNTLEEGDNKTNLGIGFYLSEKDAPLNAVFGIQGFINDLNDNAEKDTSAWERTTINLVAGFKLK
ncbi:MAG: hypothetical protein R8N23_10625 [Reichenbachiella sp.]|uniref:hypothetical protein n=1 Tax=Reichenbachiella sp. TaxID=2184521 RepID=UPI0029668B90|nr:hypothetical protein [Reichenbachiella sp.]MDW3210313.1 hypothetical protein [Reichenbachiella sp.]